MGSTTTTESMTESTIESTIESVRVQVVKERIVIIFGTRAVFRSVVARRLKKIVASYIKTFSASFPGEDPDEWDGMDGIFDGDLDYDDDSAGLLSQAEANWIQKKVVRQLKEWSAMSGIVIVGLTD